MSRRFTAFAVIRFEDFNIRFQIEDLLLQIPDLGGIASSSNKIVTRRDNDARDGDDRKKGKESPKL